MSIRLPIFVICFFVMNDALVISSELCINPSDSKKYNYITQTQCFQKQTFEDIRKKRPRVPQKTDLPSCQEMVQFALYKLLKIQEGNFFLL